MSIVGHWSEVFTKTRPGVWPEKQAQLGPHLQPRSRYLPHSHPASTFCLLQYNSDPQNFEVGLRLEGLSTNGARTRFWSARSALHLCLFPCQAKRSAFERNVTFSKGTLCHYLPTHSYPVHKSLGVVPWTKVLHVVNQTSPWPFTLITLIKQLFSPKTPQLRFAICGPPNHDKADWMVNAWSVDWVFLVVLAACGDQFSFRYKYL